ncbi:phosphoribosylformylglycinamidine synthase subunit PurQ [Brevibacillus laterosporus]|uniref:Phosphoribosylformylglycinamidine synthase subunit PurQ n=1 Tax=Brevibacillus laterosporus TaxID=1465 RepID=A0A0F7EGL2_BRELA|nr:phosphoribosylformylglycinamidine synthase subunit PurQ [Brevibacillus halotolerans]AKF93303.1 phosphoribosylformylglycinamidine synthase [Brevibacillus laterosporus]GIO02900.1 phosphoribosylformylglycinamidine synthase subunit PurQ [Brevibacillus halotolerans]
MRVAVIVFPGSNADVDMYNAVEDCMQVPVDYVWHTETDLSAYDVILLPGGFSYGDYLRCGAVARFSPVMEQVARAAQEGKFIMGVCNGFQILLETGLLPGAMLRNTSLTYRCKLSTLRVENNQTPFTNGFAKGERIEIPIAHGEGNYFCEEETLRRMQQNGQIVFRYDGENPNGSLDDIAGITNERGNVLGMMPHPERAVHSWMTSADGRTMFTSILNAWREKNGVTTYA